ncbi:MAG: hypothetical protein OEU92_09075 [Alphaproteobacteria bacterium]|nr:hypothetical protein [Alphaproteobacteria bacterium]
MQPLCTDRMKVARELLDYGVLNEGAEKLAELQDCGRRVGCGHWHLCLCAVERQWHCAGGDQRVKRAAHT